jgi:hypothetical protein
MGRLGGKVQRGRDEARRAGLSGPLGEDRWDTRGKMSDVLKKG